MNNQRDKLLLNATDSVPGPGEFPLGSIESRAAARLRLQQTLKHRVRTTYIFIGFHDPGDAQARARIDPWYENKDGSLTRNVVASSEMSEEDALEIFGTRKTLLQGKMGLYGIHH